MSPENEDPTLNWPREEDDTKGEGSAAPPRSGELEGSETIMSDPGEQMTVVNGPEEEPTLGMEGATAAAPGRTPDTDTAVDIQTGGASHVFADRFEVVALLGEGGMGRVYRVRDRQIEGREVALKVLRPRFSRNQRFRQLFFQEIRAAQNFVSEQVNQVRDTGQMDDGRLFLTMDLVEGESLRDLIKRERSLNTRHALEVTRQVLLALQSGHEQGFVHRDVKPPNIMLASRVPKTDENPYGIGVRLLDFGIAALAAEVGEGTVSGTPMYMSPEQAQGQRLDARSDLFSVGIVLYEMLAGSRPFEGTTLQEISTALVETQIAPMIKGIDNLKPAVQKILRKALEKDREKRYQSAGEFIAAIESSKAYRVPTGVPGWVGGLLAISLVAAAAEGAILYNLQSKLAQERDSHSRERDEWNDKQVAALEAQRSTFEQSQTSSAQILEDKDKTIQALRAQIAAQDTSGVDVKVDKNEMERLREELAKITTDAERRATQIMQLEKSKSQLEKDYRELKERADSSERAQRPEALAAKGLDLILEFVSGGYWAQAAKQARELGDAGVYARADLGGFDQIQLLAQGAEKLSEYREAAGVNGDRNRLLLTAAQSFAERAAEGQPLFESASRAWLGFRLDGQEAAPDRLSAFSAAVAKLQSEIAAELEAHNARNLADAQELKDGAADQDPSRVMSLGEEVGWDELDGFLQRLVALISTAEQDGRLDRVALAQNPVLDAWGQYVGTARSTIPAQYADTISWFHQAKRWYVDRDQTVSGLDLGVLSGSEGEPSSDWRSVLALQTEMFARFPSIVGHSRYYLEQPDRGPLLWVEDRVSGRVEGSGSTLRWTIDRNSYDPDRDRTQFMCQFTNGVIYGAGEQELIDLFDPAARVGWWSATEKERAPNLLRFPQQDELEEFNARFADGAACLIVTDDNATEHWFSPELGLVHQARTGVYSLDLLFVRP